MAAKLDLTSFLRQVDAFSRLSADRVAWLAAASEVREHEAGASVSDGAWKTWIWIPLQGLLRLACPMPGGESLTVFVAGRGELVGCLDRSCEEDHDLTYYAVVPSLVASLPRERVGELAARDAYLSAGIIHSLSERMWAARELRVSSALSAEQRLARALLSLTKRLGRTMPLTRKTIAEISGLARETAIRGLAPFEDSGVIRSSRGRVEVLDRPRLEKLAAY